MVRFRRLCTTLLACGALAGCGDDDPTVPGGTPDFTLTVSPTSLTVAADPPAAAAVSGASRQGTATLQVTINRTGGFTGAVTVTVEGLPTGVTASPLTVAEGSTSGTVTLTAGSTAAAGASSLTVRGSASGLTAKTATLALTVEAAEPAGSIAVSVSAAALTIAQGQSTTATVTITRTGFTGAVDLEGTSDPAGVTTSFDPASPTEATSTMTVSAGAALTPGTYSVTVTASAGGVEDATATVDVTVNQSSGGGSIQFTFCEQSGIPVWFAYQDGSGDWTQVLPNPPGVFSFDLSSGTAGVANVIQNGGDPTLTIFYGSQQEIELLGGSQCVASGATKAVSGSVAGLEATETASISLGGAFASASPAAPQFNLSNVPDGVVDLLASATSFQTDGMGGFTTTLRKMIIRRDLNPTDGSTLAVLDFASGEAFDPVSHSITVNNGMGHFTTTLAQYITANGAGGAFFTNNFGGTQYFGVPADQQADGDLHWLTVSAADIQGQDLVGTRGITNFFKTAADKTVTLGPVLNQPTVTVEATTPYVRPRVQLTTQSEYDNFWFASFGQDDNTTLIQVLGGFGVGGTLDVTLPDFTNVGGWNNDWAPQAGTETQWTTTAVGWDASGGFPGTPGFEEGNVSQTALRLGTINP